MPVTKQEVDPADKAYSDKDINEKKNDVAEALFNNLEFPSDDPNEQKDKEMLDPDEDEKKKEESQPEEEVESEESTDEEVESEEDEEDDEDVVPASKVKKRIDSEVAKRKILEARLSEMEASQTAKPVDSRKAKLENMSKQELKTLKHDAMREWKTAEDSSREDQLVELMDEIDDIVQNQPNRFAETQMAELNKSIQNVRVDDRYQDVDFDKSGKDIEAIAVDIYQKNPELHKMKTGQATALKLAVDQFVNAPKTSKGDSEKLRLKQQNKKMKRKTSLGVNTKQGSMTKADIKSKRDALRKEGNTIKRAEFVQDLLDIDKYLPEKLRGK